MGFFNLELCCTIETTVDMLILAWADINGHIPFDPTVSLGAVQVDILASGTLLLVILQGPLLPQDNTQFEHHPRLDLVGKFQATDTLAVLGTYHLIITSLHIMTSNAIFAIAVDDMVKVLVCRDERYHQHAEVT